MSSFHQQEMKKQTHVDHFLAILVFAVDETTRMVTRVQQHQRASFTAVKFTQHRLVPFCAPEKA